MFPAMIPGIERRIASRAAVPGARDGKYTEVRSMGMEIPGILKTNPVPDVLLKEARAVHQSGSRVRSRAAEVSRQEIENRQGAGEDVSRVQPAGRAVRERQINQVIIKVVDARNR